MEGTIGRDWVVGEGVIYKTFPLTRFFGMVTYF